MFQWILPLLLHPPVYIQSLAANIQLLPESHSDMVFDRRGKLFREKKSLIKSWNIVNGTLKVYRTTASLTFTKAKGVSMTGLNILFYN